MRAAWLGVRRLVHVSALGLDQRVTSGFLISKRHGEAALRARSFDCVIVRPSLLDGADGYGARWFRKVARWPVHFIPASARGRVAPLDVDDLGVALAVLCELDTPAVARDRTRWRRANDDSRIPRALARRAVRRERPARADDRSSALARAHR